MRGGSPQRLKPMAYDAREMIRRRAVWWRLRRRLKPESAVIARTLYGKRLRVYPSGNASEPAGSLSRSELV